MKDTVEPAVGGFLEISLRNGWCGLLSVNEILSVKPRTEGGSVIHLRSAERPILVSVPVDLVIAAMEGAVDETA